MNATQRLILVSFFKGYWKAYALIIAFSLFLAGIEALHLGLLYPVLNELLGSPAAPLGRLGRLMDDVLRLVPVQDKLVAGCILLIVLTPLKGALSIAYEWLVAWMSSRILYRTKGKILDQYAGAPFQYFIDNKIGELVHYAIIAPTRLATILTRMPQVLVESLRVAAVMVILAVMQPLATALLVVLGFLAYLALNVLSRDISYTLGKERVAMGTTQHGLLQELIVGVKQIRVFGSKGWWLSRFDAASRRFSELFTRDAVLVSSPKHVIETLALTGLFGALLALKLRSPGELFASLPVAGTFCVALMKLLPSLAAISRNRLELMGSLPEIEGIHKTLMAELAPSKKPGAKVFEKLGRGVVFEDVRLDYRDRKNILKGVNLEIAAGSSTALAGDSGCGKTTVLNMLLGLLQPTGGRILVDGVPLDEHDQDSWRSKLAFVSQEAFIFSGTVAENILFGREGFSLPDLERAAKLAHAHEFIASLPQGYETPVGERGQKLSGGQQQRLAIARAVLGSPQILLFDEATSALDSVSEAAVQAAIAEVSKGRTVVQIAHRLSTIEGADRIYVMHEGRVVESGDHASLIKSGGRYAAFHGLQSR